MIVVQIALQSAISRDRDTDLGTVIIGNRGDGTRSRGNYDVRAYAKGALARRGGDGFRLWAEASPTREGVVVNHARLAEPVSNLVAKSLTALGYR